MVDLSSNEEEMASDTVAGDGQLSCMLRESGLRLSRVICDTYADTTWQYTQKFGGGFDGFIRRDADHVCRTHKGGG